MNKNHDTSLSPICVINNIHGLFMYYLIDPEVFKKTIFVISDGIPLSVQKKLPAIIFVPSFDKHPKFISLFLRAVYFLYKNTCLYFKNRKTIVYGHDHLFFSQLYIKRASSFILIEDGLANYISDKKSRRSLIRKMLFGSNGPYFGWSKDINKIILSGIIDTPNQIIDKVSLINISTRWGNLTPVQKRDFIELFSSESYKPLSKVVIFTQPFSEDGMMSEVEKIDIYKIVYEHYCRIYNKADICIKSHPREETNYSLYFDCSFIKSKIPGQIMILIDRPDVLATIYSSVGFVKGDVQTHVWGTSFNELLLKKVGYFDGNYNGLEDYE